MKKIFRKVIIFGSIYTYFSCSHSQNSPNEYTLHANLWNVYDNYLYVDSLNVVNKRKEGMASSRVLCLRYRVHNPYSKDLFLPLDFHHKSTIKAYMNGSSMSFPDVDQCEIIGLNNSNFIIHPDDTVCISFRLLNFVNINDGLHKADTKVLLSKMQVSYNLDSLDLDKKNAIVPFIEFENDTNNILINYKINEAQKRND